MQAQICRGVARGLAGSRQTRGFDRFGDVRHIIVAGPRLLHAVLLDDLPGSPVAAEHVHRVVHRLQHRVWLRRAKREAAAPLLSVCGINTCLVREGCGPEKGLGSISDSMLMIHALQKLGPRGV